MTDSGPGSIPHFQVNVGVRGTLTVCSCSETRQKCSGGPEILPGGRVGAFRQNWWARKVGLPRRAWPGGGNHCSRETVHQLVFLIKQPPPQPGGHSPRVPVLGSRASIQRRFTNWKPLDFIQPSLKHGNSSYF